MFHRLYRFLPVAGLLALLSPLCASASDGSAAPISQTEGGSRVVAVSAGEYHSCGLQADGAVSCWGRNAEGQSAAPTGPFVAVSAGYLHSCGLKADGAVSCWGNNVFGQLAVPAGSFVAVSASGYHSCGLRADGAVACWGYNGYGQTTAPAGSFLAVSAGLYHSCGLKADGAVACWGLGNIGQTTAPAGPFVAVSAGDLHSCGVKADGAVACWGDNGHGQTTAPGGPFLAVSAGHRHSCGLKADGTVACWGDTDQGQSTAPAALQEAGSSAFGQIAAGNAHACQVRRDGTLACWGLNDEGQTNAPEGSFTQVVAGDSHSCAIGTDGQLTCWGRNATATNSALNGPWRQLAPAPNGAVCALNAGSGEDRCSRGGYYTGEIGYSVSAGRFRNITHNIHRLYQGLCGVLSKEAPNGTDSYCGSTVPPGNGYGFDDAHADYFTGGYQRIESGLNHQCGLKLDGSIECWGNNDHGQTDDVPSGPFRTFSVGWNHACAIRANGQLACWGHPENGKTVAPAGTFVQVAAGNTFTCAIRSNGTRVCWGSNNHGQAPQLALSPSSIAGVQVNTAHVGATFSLTEDDYLPESPAYAVVAGSLPPGLSLSAAGVLSGTPTAGGTFTFTVEGEDANGFTASRGYTVTIIADSTPPVIGYTLTPAAPDGSNGWYVSDIGIDWTVSDAESSVSGIIGCVDEALNTDTPGTTRSCTASSLGGSASLTTEVLKRDATAPTLAPTTPSPLLRGQSYVASPNASDATSGIASSSCGALDTSTLGEKSLACNARDNAGNTNEAELAYTVTTTCVNDGYKNTQLNWCKQICESGLTGKALDTWIHRWVAQFHDLPYCRVGL